MTSQAPIILCVWKATQAKQGSVLRSTDVEDSGEEHKLIVAGAVQLVGSHALSVKMIEGDAR